MKTTSAKNTDAAHTSSSHGRGAEGPFLTESQKEDPFFHNNGFFQPKLTIGAPDDPYEREADAMADRIVNADPSPTFFNPSPGGDLQTKPAFESPSVLDQETLDAGAGTDPPVQRREEEELQTKSDAPAAASANFTSQLSSSKGQGAPLPDPTRRKMESGFGTDFSGVRIHDGPRAEQMNRQIGARAFTHGNDIYFNRGQYAPGAREGDRLLAHELTHTIQQGAVVHPKLMNGLANTAPDIQADFLRDLIDGIVDILDTLGVSISEIVDHIPGYTLFSYVMEYDFIRGRPVERTGINLIRGLMGLVPGGELLFQKLQEYGVIERAFAWVEAELSRLNLTMSRIERLIDEAWDEMGITEGISGNLRILANKFQGLYNDVVSFAGSLVDELIEMLKEALVRPMVEFMENRSDAVKLAFKVIGRKFPLEDPVEATTEEILRDFLILIGRETEVEQMEEKGTLKETADWIDTQIARFFSLVDRFQVIFTRVWEAFSLDTLSDVIGTFESIYNDFMVLLDDFFAFAWEVAAKVLEIIKNALLSWLNSFAADIPGFTLLTVIIGKNPLTDEEAPRTVENIIRGFMGLIPGGETKFQQLKQTGVIPQAVQRIEALMAELGISWAMVKNLFSSIWDSLSIEDLINPIAAFERIAAQFGEPIARLFAFVSRVIRIVIELILHMMNIPPELVASIINRAMQAFEDIKNDPIGFLLNLLRAVKQGFEQFFGNILTHLAQGLQTWLFGTLADAGIQIPSDFSFRSILGLALDILGVTVDNILDRLALQIGQERVDQIRGALEHLSGLWAFVRDVIERGPIAIWEYVEQQLSNLWDMIINGVREWIMTRLIEAAITKVMSMLDPTGVMAVVNSFIAFFRAVQSFIEKLREILEIINSFVAGVAEIARGSIQSAANYLENALADGIPVALAFLAKQVGLGNLAEKITEMIEAIRERINAAIDWLIERALAAGTAMLNMITGGGDQPTTEDEAAEARSVEGDVFSPANNEASFSIEDSNESHDLYVDERGGIPTLIIESDPTPLLTFLDNYENHYRDELTANRLGKIQEARDFIAAQITPLVNQITDAKAQNEPQAQIDGLLGQLLRKNASLGLILREALHRDLDIGEIEERYALEGLAGQFGSIPEVTGDNLEADHQPQNSIYVWMATELVYFSQGPRGTNVRARAAGRSQIAYAINLHHNRHAAGRTYGGRAIGTLNQFKAAVESATSSHNDDQAKRDAVIDLLKIELREDVAAMRAVYAQPVTSSVWADINELDIPTEEKERIANDIRSRVNSGEDQMLQQPMDNLKR